MLLKKISSWIRKHRRVLSSRPANGTMTMLEMDGLLIEISDKRTRIDHVAKSARANTTAIKEAYEELNAVANTKN